MFPRFPSAFAIARQRLPCQNWSCVNNVAGNISALRKRFSSTTASPMNSEATSGKPYYITTPIFYVNADPHVGHFYTMVLTDIIKRWQVLKGRTAILCTGTDEHGLKIQQAASQAGLSPRTFCDSGAETFKNLAAAANVSNDHFIRTTDPAHYDTVQYFWERLQDGGYIYTEKHEGWYSVSDETFYSSSGVKQVLDNATGRKIMASLETGKQVEWTSEINYHFRLSAMAPQLLDHYKKNPEFVVPAMRYKTVIDAVESGLSDLSISRPRDRLTWGIQVPGDEQQTIYVWLDALVNYLTVTGYPWTPGKDHEGGWPPEVQVIGKDIVRFHCIYWPAFLLALNLPLPKQILTHAHWTMNRRKMSKSVGNVVNPFFAIDRYGVDTMRFYLAHDGGIIDDGDYSNESIVERYRVMLQGGLGNLVNRVCGKKFDIVASRQGGLELAGPLDDADKKMVEAIETVVEKTEEKMRALQVPLALKEIMEVVSLTNKYLQNAAPWSLKKPEEKARRDRIIFISTEAVRITGILLQAFIPEKAEQLLDQIKVMKEHRGLEFARLGKDKEYG
ncbi:methionyl-tRNA synthetase, partial [Rhizina undulata]